MPLTKAPAVPILRSLASALLALPFFAACASAPAPDASTGDASANDAAVADATSTPDAPPADATAIDAAPRAADCRLVDGVLVGSECLPRCSLRTQMAVEGCGGLRDANSRGCRDFQLSSDSTPPLALPDGDTVTCPSCIQYQSNRCSQMSCPSEYAAVVRCEGSSSSCTRERDALSDCLQPFGWACFDRETARCFGAQSTAGGTACLAGVSGSMVCREYPEFASYDADERALLQANCTDDLGGSWVPSCPSADVIGVCSLAQPGSYPFLLKFYRGTSVSDAMGVCSDASGTWMAGS